MGLHMAIRLSHVIFPVAELTTASELAKKAMPLEFPLNNQVWNTHLMHFMSCSSLHTSPPFLFI